MIQLLKDTLKPTLTSRKRSVHRSSRARLVWCGCGAKLGIDLLARDRVHPTHDHTIVRSQTLLDHAQIPNELSRLDLALLDDTVLVDDEDVAAALVATERNIGYEQACTRATRSTELTAAVLPVASK
jgi:hypothetical protein